MQTEYNREAVIAKINSLSAMGAPSPEIARKLNEDGFKTRAGLTWNNVRLNAFKQVLANQAKRADRPKPAGKRVLKTAAKPAATPQRREPAKAGSSLEWITLILNRPDWSAEKKIRVLSACIEP